MAGGMGGGVASQFLEVFSCDLQRQKKYKVLIFNYHNLGVMLQHNAYE